jgi:hypothetical protein
MLNEMVQDFQSKYKISKQDEKCFDEIRKHSVDLRSKLNSIKV